MYDISIFNKELKGGFAQGYNRRHQRYGVLWAERFKSVLLEGGRAVKAISAYIELNPVRAGLCEDPKEYRGISLAAAEAEDQAQVQERPHRPKYPRSSGAVGLTQTASPSLRLIYRLPIGASESNQATARTPLRVFS
jgi:hypothetical protein